METIIFKPIHSIYIFDLDAELINNILGEWTPDRNEIYEGNTNNLNDPIKIDTLRKYLDVLEEKGSNYVAIDVKPDHRGLDIDGVFITLATQEEIDLHKQKDKDFQLNFCKERVNVLSTELKRFQDKLKELSDE